MLLTSRRRALEGALFGLIMGSAVACGSSNSDPVGSNGGASGSGTGGSAGASGGSSGAGGNTGGSGGGMNTGGTTGGSGGTPTTGGSPGTGGSSMNTFDAGSDPNRNRVMAGQVCDRLSTVQCAAEQACCASPGRTFESCKTTIQTQCVNEFYLDAVSLNAVAGYSVDAAEAAFTEFENLASMCDTGIADWGATTEGLRGITLGTLGSGANCTPPNLTDLAQSAGYLAACMNSATTACLPSLLTWTCTARSAAGGSCFTDLNCQDGLYCPNPNLAITGAQCAQRKANGQSCATGNECASLQCKGGQCVTADQQAVYCLTN